VGVKPKATAENSAGSEPLLAPADGGKSPISDKKLALREQTKNILFTSEIREHNVFIYYISETRFPEARAQPYSSTTS